jgi:sulfide:quinone oxidoreductase
MKRLLILGAGTGGTMVANQLVHKLDPSDWEVTVVDREVRHFYQPGFLFIPFGVYKSEDVVRPKRRTLHNGIKIVFADIEAIHADQSKVSLSDGQSLPYDELVIATGCEIRPDQINGLKGPGWQKNVFDFYTLEGAAALAEFLASWDGGRLVLNVAEMPIKCPVAPLEFLFLADWYFHRRGMRNKVELVYATPLSGAFTKPKAAKALGKLLEQKDIHMVTDFNISEVDENRQAIRSWDERQESYDLLVSIPTNMGSEAIERSGLGDELNYVPTDRHTLKSKAYENIWVLGDATDLPSSKAGSVAHFQQEVLVENLLAKIHGQPMQAMFDGHANCFIETGFDRGVMIDFNYDVEPLPGSYPLPGVGPFSLLQESRINHLGKLSFKWVYWNLLLPGRGMPVSNQLSMAGKAN